MKARKATAKAEAAAKISADVESLQKLLGTQYISQQDYDTARRMHSRLTRPLWQQKQLSKPRASTGLYQSDLPYQRSYW